jgi:hypothetical protein
MKKSVYSLAFVFMVSSFLFLACKKKKEEPKNNTNTNTKGNRVLGMSINMPANNDFNAAYDRAKSVGAEVSQVELKWKEIETSPNVYDANIGLLFTTMNTFLPAKGMKLALVIKAVDGSEKSVPTDLASVSFNDTAMTGRYNRMQKFLLQKIPNVTIHSYCIGINTGAYISANAGALTAYTAFYNNVSTYAKTLRTDLKTGINIDYWYATFNNDAQTLNQNTDFISVSYVPLNLDYTARPSNQIEGDWNNLTAKFTKPIYLHYVAYPSSTLCNSSENQQKQAITDIFKNWDKYKDKIPYLSYFTYSDFSQQQVDDIFSASGNNDPIAKDYLRTVGLIRHDGTDKPAISEFQNQAKSRGW